MDGDMDKETYQKKKKALWKRCTVRPFFHERAFFFGFSRKLADKHCREYEAKAEAKAAAMAEDLDEDFYGSDEFNQDEFDAEGFDEMTFEE